MKSPEPPFSNSVPVATLHGETHLVLQPDSIQRERVAGALGLHRVDKLVARLAISQAANGLVSIEGTLNASVQPICVVSLEPFDQAIDEPVTLRLAPPDLIARMTKRAEDDGVEDFEPPDEIADGVIDFGALVTEFLMLALDPYPRKPGAEFPGLAEDIEPVSPFEALKTLKLKDSG